MYESNNYNYTNQNAVQNTTFMEMRLSTEKILQKIEYFLSAKRKVLVQEGEVFTEKYESFGEPLANKEGINNLLHIVGLRIDSHVVQGNLEDDHYWEFIARARNELKDEVVTNCYDWGIDDNKIELVVDTIMAFIEPFMSRTIDNKEREGYGIQIQSRETLANDQRQGWMPPLRK